MQIEIWAFGGHIGHLITTEGVSALDTYNNEMVDPHNLIKYITSKSIYIRSYIVVVILVAILDISKKILRGTVVVLYRSGTNRSPRQRNH